MSELYFPFTLRLYARTLLCLGDHNFTGLDLFYRIKDCWKHRDQPYDLLLSPLEPGLSLKIGEWCFDTLFDVEDVSPLSAKRYIRTLWPEDAFWFVGEVCEAARLSSFFGNAPLIKSMVATIRKTEALFGKNDNRYWKDVRGEVRRALIKTFVKFTRDLRDPLTQMRQLYSYEISDRILHDRQLCNFIARTVMEIGFDGETVKGLRSQWVARERWPVRVKDILLARDRGKCASCGTDLAQELRGAQHIDHMFPLSQGGCNDLVNLQLLCSDCNLAKSGDEARITTSVPQYIRRPKKSAS
jgi:HNH endonuclease